MDIGVSPLTNTIFAGKSRPVKDGIGYEWVGKKKDVTRDVIAAAFEWMYNKSETTGTYEITIPDFGTMRFERKFRG